MTAIQTSAAPPVFFRPPSSKTDFAASPISNVAPVIVAQPIKYPEPSTALKKQVVFHDLFYREKIARSTALLRAVRKARAGTSAAVVFADAKKAYRDFVRAQERLKQKEALLPDNQKLPYPSIQLDQSGRETSFPREIIRFYDDWIKDAQASGQGHANIHYLKSQKLFKLKRLQQETKAILEDQRASGLWALRVDAGARRFLLSSLLFEACSVRLASLQDCKLAADFIRLLTRLDRAKPEYQYDLNPYQVSSLSKRLAARLAKGR
ncbi:hypothetical protein IVB46_44230 [Bradyrhizobium sp. 61]|uniref:hypothetical protein n=1 Tax=Bradyrhizobium sp. 61 TaxID=2782679 RepID=UPI001FFB5D42|nr:hypothetical protein [Bradyrhizobium sp. 61]MCK1282246.1 hypothetical protein [Bradyrhizobium sp. 61]